MSVLLVFILHISVHKYLSTYLTLNNLNRTLRFSINGAQTFIGRTNNISSFEKQSKIRFHKNWIKHALYTSDKYIHTHSTDFLFVLQTNWPFENKQLSKTVFSMKHNYPLLQFHGDSKFYSLDQTFWHDASNSVTRLTSCNTK